MQMQQRPQKGKRKQVANRVLQKIKDEEKKKNGTYAIWEAVKERTYTRICST